jgi:hypothetical protein
MKPETTDKLTRFLLTLICFTVYMCAFVTVIANAFRTNAYELLFG